MTAFNFMLAQAPRIRGAMVSVVFLLGIFGLSVPTFAHHSQSYFSKDFSEIEGEIIEMDWRNPHIRFNVRTVNDSGEEEIRRVETNSIYYLERAGVTEDRINVGDHVVVGGYASTRPGGEFLGAKMLLADGEVADFIRTAVTERFNDQVVDAASENKGIFRVWSIPQENDREVVTPLNDMALEKKAEFDLFDNFTSTCEPVGMPRIMWYPHPYAFEDRGDTILMRTEMYDAQRTIYMRDEVSNPTPSIMGYSVGHWEDGTLVVKTTAINWEFYDTQGSPQSDQIEVVERYQLSEDQSRLDYHIVSTDPVHFTAAATIDGHWLALGEEVKPYNCEVY